MLLITPWERKALQLLADGVPAQAMAACLGASEREVESSLAELFAKLGAPCHAEALAVALRRGLITLAGAPEASAA